MGRRKHSKIDNLEPAVKETVDEMIKTGAYYREIVDYIQSHGVSISLAAVGKYAKNLMSTLDALRLSQENFRAIMEETDRYPDLDMTDGILRLLCNQMLDAINKLPEERLSEIDFDTLSKKCRGTHPCSGVQEERGHQDTGSAGKRCRAVQGSDL